MPNNPYYESDDIDECISIANLIHEKHNVCVYVVDTKPVTMYDEVYAKISSDFREVFDERFRRRKRLS